VSFLQFYLCCFSDKHFHAIQVPWISESQGKTWNIKSVQPLTFTISHPEVRHSLTRTNGRCLPSRIGCGPESPKSPRSPKWEAFNRRWQLKTHPAISCDMWSERKGQWQMAGAMQFWKPTRTISICLQMGYS